MRYERNKQKKEQKKKETAVPAEKARGGTAKKTEIKEQL